MGKVKYLLKTCKMVEDRDCQEEHVAHISYEYYKKHTEIVDAENLRKIIIYKEN